MYTCFFNALIFNMLQKAVFYMLKGGLLRCHMRQIGTRYAAYWKTGGAPFCTVLFCIVGKLLYFCIKNGVRYARLLLL